MSDGCQIAGGFSEALLGDRGLGQRTSAASSVRALVNRLERLVQKDGSDGTRTDRTGIRDTVKPADLELWMTTQGLAEIRDGRLVATPKAVGLIDALSGPDHRGDGVRRGYRIA